MYVRASDLASGVRFYLACARVSTPVGFVGRCCFGPSARPLCSATGSRVLLFSVPGRRATPIPPPHERRVSSTCILPPSRFRMYIRTCVLENVVQPYIKMIHPTHTPSDPYRTWRPGSPRTGRRRDSTCGTLPGPCLACHTT